MVSIPKTALPCHRLPTSVNVRIASSSSAMDILLFYSNNVFCLLLRTYHEELADFRTVGDVISFLEKQSK